MFKKKTKNTATSAPAEEVVNFSSSIELETTEEKLKSDGAIVIGSLGENNSFIATNAPLPEQIDVEALRKAALYNIELKKKKGKVELDKEAKRVQSIVALVVLLLFCAVGGFFYYHKNLANNKDFTLKKVHVEYGQPVSLAIATYVNIEDPDEKLYTLDLSEFVPDEMGEYTYKISYSGKVKTGVIEISDTLPPEVELKDVLVQPGDTYTPNMFINKCSDLNDCYVTFEDGTTIKTAKEAGESSVYLVVKDKLGNTITKQAKLNTVSTDVVYSCSNAKDFNYDLGYRETTTYEIIFDKDYNYLSSKLLTTYEYVDNNEYLKYKENHLAEAYTYDDSLSKVTHKVNNEDGFEDNKDYASIAKYLKDKKYTCSVVHNN